MPAGSPPGGDLLRLAAFSGLVAGLLESAGHLVRRALDGTVLSLGPYLAWMPAAANLLLFVTLGVLLLLLRWRAPGFCTPARVTGFFGALTMVAALQALEGWLGTASMLLLALGVGVQTGRLTGRWWGAGARLSRPALPVLAAFLLLVAAGLEVGSVVRERRALAALPNASPNAPNVLLLVLDTVRERNLSAYGYPLRTTPALERLAAEGVRFGRAHSTAPWTLPSHASMMTGRWAHEMSANWLSPLDGRDSTLAQVLAARGYRTGAIVGNLAYTSPWTGLDRGFQHYAAHRVTLSQVLRTAGLTRRLYDWGPLARRLPPALGDSPRKPAAEVNAGLLRWLDAAPGRPFFAFLNYFDAHDPYLPAAPFDTAFASAGYPALPARGEGALHIMHRPQPMRPYDQAIASIDAEIGRLLEALEARDLRRNTLIIVTSDHGEEFGEHGVWGHGHTLYLPALRVPLILSLPGRIPAGLVVHSPASVRDLPATVFDLAIGIPEGPFPGRSLARFWRAPSPPADTLLLETRWARNRPRDDATSRGDLQGAIAGDLALIRGVGLPEELYRLSGDSAEQVNLADDVGMATARRQLERLLDRLVDSPAAAERHLP